MQEETPSLRIVGRPSSLFTRLPLLYAHVLGVDYGFDTILDMTRLSPQDYAGNPALKLPILRTGDQVVFGAANICRVIARRAAGRDGAAPRVVWPEEVPGLVAANAHELLAHCMSAQVQYVMGVQVAGLPADSPFFTKTLAGMRGALQWLDENLEELLAALPATRALSWFEAGLFCLLEHLAFRQTVAWQQHARLMQFAARFGRHPAAMATAYRYPQPL